MKMDRPEEWDMASDIQEPDESNKPSLDPAKIAADLKLRLSPQEIEAEEIWAQMKTSPLFEQAGNPIREKDGGFVLIDKAVHLDYPVSVWINYKPYSPEEGIVENDKASKEHIRSCLRDGWGRIFIIVDPEFEGDDESVCAIMDLMRHEAWGDLEHRVSYHSFEEF